MATRVATSSGRRRCVFVTVFWGDWHRTAFLDSNLPTMLAPGNLPALADGTDCEYLIYTTSRDAQLMEHNRAFQRLRSILPVSLKLFKPSKTNDVISLHHEIWRAATEYARQQAAFILLMPPDVAWADGSFARLHNAFASGKQVMFMSYPRVVSETIAPAMAEQFPRDAGGAMVIPARDLMALAITHIHPLMAAYDRGATHFPIHPEMILWPIKGDGFLLRLLARELFCFQPGRYPLNAQSLLARVPPDDEIAVFDDSREFLGISLTPLWKDMEWYLAPRRLDPLFAGRWWIDYDSPMNDRLSGINLRFTCGTTDESRWRATEAQADALLAHLRSAREFVRVLMTLDGMRHVRAAGFLASALRVLGLARRWPHRGPFILLAPTDEAFERAEFDRIPGDGMNSTEARKIIEAHLADLPSHSPLADGTVLTTLAGNKFLLEDAKQAIPCGPNLVVPSSQILCRTHIESDPAMTPTYRRT